MLAEIRSFMHDKITSGALDNAPTAAVSKCDAEQANAQAQKTAAVAALACAASTLPLFASAHACAAANGSSTGLRLALACSQPPWQLCAGATYAARGVVNTVRSVDARVPCCHHMRKAHNAARAPGQKAEATAPGELEAPPFAAPDEFPEA